MKYCPQRAMVMKTPFCRHWATLLSRRPANTTHKASRSHLVFSQYPLDMRPMRQWAKAKSKGSRSKRKRCKATKKALRWAETMVINLQKAGLAVCRHFRPVEESF